MAGEALPPDALSPELAAAQVRQVVRELNAALRDASASGIIVEIAAHESTTLGEHASRVHVTAACFRRTQARCEVI